MFEKTFTPSKSNNCLFHTTVRFADPTTRFALIRVLRSDYDKIRSTLTLMTSLAGRRAAVLIVNVNGSVRTAKRSAIEQIRKVYRQRIARLVASGDSLSNKNRTVNTECAHLENTLASLNAIDF